MDRDIDGSLGALPTSDTLELEGALILVAEDDEINRRLTTEILRRGGYRVHAVADGEAVMPALQDGSVDLLLLDVGLPRADGIAITRRIRSESRFTALPILLLTGRDAERDVVAGLDAGANDYITKPVLPTVLRARVRSALRTRRALLGIAAAHAVVAALANAIEAKDRATERHSRRLGTYAAALGQDVGLAPADLHAVTYGALLHDLGKIGVPETVLLKEGPLDEEEWQLMRRHTEIGERIAAPLLGSSRFGPIIRHHHERWDGLGYPDGLKGESIPVGARIVAVVDAFDAMTRSRVYQRARTVEAAMEELRRGRRRQFDPVLVDGFLGIVERVGILDETSVREQAWVASEGTNKPN